jgi:hypothetical protein
MMRSLILSISFLLVCGLTAFAQDGKPSIEALGWLAGCWVNADKGPDVTEHWLKPAGGMMMGMGRTVKDGKVTTYEFTRIYQEANGDIFFAAKLPKQEEVAFKLRWAWDGVFKFENLEHDFPQRVIYTQGKDGQLTGRIEGKKDGKEIGFDFPMKRTGC